MTWVRGVKESHVHILAFLVGLVREVGDRLLHEAVIMSWHCHVHCQIDSKLVNPAVEIFTMLIQDSLSPD
jgi:hypothetical protein